MKSEYIPVTFNKIVQSRSYTVIVLGSGSKQFAIYTEPSVGKMMQGYLTKQKPQRPLTHDLLSSVLFGLEAKPLQIVIQDLEDTVYFARLFLEQSSGEKKTVLEIDARPSDCITLAILHNIPLFCRKEVLDKAIALEE